MKRINTFKERVIDVVRTIPKGREISYGKVSECAGVVGASRAVGSIMSNNKDKNIPCHRVVRSDGSIGQYNGLRTAQAGKSANNGDRHN